MAYRIQYSLKWLMAAVVCAAFFFGGMVAQRAIDLREQRRLDQQASEMRLHEQILDIRIENAVRKNANPQER